MYTKYIKQTKGDNFYIEQTNNIEEKYVQSAYFIKNAKNICVLTGAGISTNTGIPDFRSKNGWYNKEPEDILSFDNFIKDPKEVYAFLYKYFKLINVEPSKSHKILAELEDMKKNIAIITQNIDKLHHKAGSTDIIEFHGGLDKAECILCNKEYDITRVLNENIYNEDFNYRCSCGGYIKPNITLFEEDIKELTFAKKEISRADLVIVIGTSLQVAPFSTLPLDAQLDVPIIIINKDKTHLDDMNMAITINEDCDAALVNIVKSTECSHH